MPSWRHLPVEQRSLLVDEVLRLFREGIRDKYLQVLKDEQGLTPEEIAAPEVQQDIADVVGSLVTPEPPLALADLGAGDAAAVARGKELYVKQGCHSCHGNEGKGDGVQQMFDETGIPTRPRDLTRGIYKGGYDAVSLYRRIYHGMPGTPMPTSQALSVQQIGDMVHFLRSLSTEEQRAAAVIERRQLKAQRVRQVSDDPQSPLWRDAPSVTVQLVPLWWRDEVDPQAHVQVIHDGQLTAVRLSWSDSTQNSAAVLSDEFEDMAAIQLHQGGAEPFLGMGATAATIDLWQWRAGWDQSGRENSLLDEYPLDTPEHQQRSKGQPLPDFATARAAGNPLSARKHSGSNLVARGFGSVTFRPTASQLVQTKQLWSDGRWNVVLVRPMRVAADDGIALEPGQTYSIAFAVWNGAQRDRAGQKLISIWNDLRVE
jgi:mono/diheme cytochrome c family protein